MTIDAFAAEPQFLDHLSPIWRGLPTSVRGTFYVDEPLLGRARGIDVQPFDANGVRRQGLPPKAKPPQGRRALVASIGDAKVARRLGYGDFCRVEHGAGQTYLGQRTGSYAGGPDNEDASLVLVPNEYSAGHWRRAYPAADVRVVGCPKLADLPGREPGPGPVVAVSFHWPCFVAPETQPAYEFVAALPDLAREFTVIGHQHPKWTTMQGPPSRHYRRTGIEFVPEFEDVCRRADLLVFDNTSVGFEFASTGRPVVVLNARGYRKQVQHGGRFWDWATVGPQVDAPRDPNQAAPLLIAAVRRALELRPPDVAAREAALDLVYAHRTGAAERAAAAVAEWAQGRAEVAA